MEEEKGKKEKKWRSVNIAHDSRRVNVRLIFFKNMQFFQQCLIIAQFEGDDRNTNDAQKTKWRFERWALMGMLNKLKNRERQMITVPNIFPWSLGGLKGLMTGEMCASQSKSGCARILNDGEWSAGVGVVTRGADRLLGMMPTSGCCSLKL